MFPCCCWFVFVFPGPDCTGGLAVVEVVGGTVNVIGLTGGSGITYNIHDNVVYST